MTEKRMPLSEFATMVVCKLEAHEAMLLVLAELADVKEPLREILDSMAKDTKSLLSNWTKHEIARLADMLDGQADEKMVEHAVLRPENDELQ